MKASRCFRELVLVVGLGWLVPGCGGADDEESSSGEEADDDATPDDGDDDEPASPADDCSIRVSGAETADVTGCRVTLSYFPDGGSLVGGRRSTMLTVVANLANGAELPEDFMVVSLGFELDGRPSVGMFTLDDSPDDNETLASIRRSDGTATYSNVEELTLDIERLESLGEVVAIDERVENFFSNGTVTAVVSSTTDPTERVTFEGSF